MSSAAQRVREHRARKKRNASLLMIEIPSELPDALADAGFLAEWDTEDPDAIRKAIEQVLAQMITG